MKYPVSADLLGDGLEVIFDVWSTRHSVIVLRGAYIYALPNSPHFVVDCIRQAKVVLMPYDVSEIDLDALAGLDKRAAECLEDVVAELVEARVRGPVSREAEVLRYAYTLYRLLRA